MEDTMFSVINKTKYFIFFMIIFLAGFISSGCSSDENPAGTNGTPAANEVVMQGDVFTPGSLTVTAGTTVRWINRDNHLHTVTAGAPGAPSGLFDSGNIGANGDFTFTFSQAGTFPYFCGHHAGMAGIIVVE
jgi:plastocyanin